MIVSRSGAQAHAGHGLPAAVRAAEQDRVFL
jgi:hypothetical protein